MRTTVTLDPDVAAEIERIRKQEGRRFKHVLNDALRAGLRELSRSRSNLERTPVTTPHDLGNAATDITDISAALAWAEGEDHK
jgi:hypothetical protein